MSDTFTFVQAGMAAHPGTCLICGYDRRDMIDFHRDVEYYGAILVCLACMNDLGTVPELDFCSRIELEEARALNNSLSETVQQYEGLRKKLEDGLVRVANDFSVDFDSVVHDRNIPVSRAQNDLIGISRPAPKNAGYPSSLSESAGF